MGKSPDRKVQKAVSGAELEVLKVLWETGPATARQVETALRRRRRKWAYTTLLTLLSRLGQKGCVARESSGQTHIFRASVSREGLLGGRLTELVEQVCDGLASPLMHALIQNTRLSAEDVAHLRRLLDRHKE